jgi:hypothetical protein
MTANEHHGFNPPLTPEQIRENEAMSRIADEMVRAWSSPGRVPPLWPQPSGEYGFVEHGFMEDENGVLQPCTKYHRPEDVFVESPEVSPRAF